MADASQNQEGSSESVPANGQNSAPPIRTMKDDLASPAPTPPASASSKQSFDINTSPKAESPAKPAPSNDDQPVLPSTPTNNRKKIIIAIIVIAAVLLAGGAGAGYFLYKQEDTSAPAVVAEPSPVIMSALEVVPANATTVLRYNLAQVSDKQRMARAWQEQDNSTPIINLLSGNPSHLLSNDDVTELMYVSLAGDPRPYLVVPKSDSIDEIIAQQTDEQVTEHNGWYILHPLSVASYDAALGQGTLSQVVSQSLNDNFPLHLIVTNNVIEGSHEHVDMAYPAIGAEGHVLLNGQVSATGTVTLLTNDNILTNTNASNNLNQGTNSIYKFVPGDAEFIWHGQDLNDDLATLATSRGFTIDTAVLQKLPVNNFLQTLPVPYVYYERQGVDSVNDFGLVVNLPNTLLDGEQALELGDPNLEATLQALIPRITGQSAVSDLAFNDAVYSGVNLKFINLVSTAQALDYAIHDDKLLVATSKEGMSQLIDTVNGDAPNVTQQSLWTELFTEATRLPQSRVQVATSIRDPIFAKLFPVGLESVPVVAQSSFVDSGALQLDAALGWGTVTASVSTAPPTPAISPATSPQPSPSASLEPSPANEDSPASSPETTPTPSPTPLLLDDSTTSE